MSERKLLLLANAVKYEQESFAGLFQLKVTVALSIVHRPTDDKSDQMTSTRSRKGFHYARLENKILPCLLFHASQVEAVAVLGHL